MKKVVLKSEDEIIIRKAAVEDGEKIIDYMYAVGEESEYLAFGANELEITIQKERQIIEDINSKDNSIMAVALLDGEIVGSIVFRGGERSRIRHVGELGVTVRKSYWGLGIGSALMEYLIEWAKDTGIIRKINLRVRTDNKSAIKLYKKYEFKEEGILTRDFCVDGKFFDSLHMGLSIDLSSLH